MDRLHKHWQWPSQTDVPGHRASRRCVTTDGRPNGRHRQLRHREPLTPGDDARTHWKRLIIMPTRAAEDTPTPAGRAPGGGNHERVTVNLNTRASDALDQVAELTGETKTDSI